MFSIHFEFFDPVSPVVFKSTFQFSHLIAYKIFYSFYHNDKGKSSAVHVTKIISAEISPVQDKSDIFIRDNNNAVSNIAGFARQINDLKNDQLIEMLKIWINHLDSSFPIKRSQLEQFKKLLNNKKKPYGEIRLAKKHFLVKKKDEVFFKNKNKKI